MKSLIAAFLMGSALSLSGCALFNAKKPKVDLNSIYIQDSTALSTTLVFVLDVQNPNKMDINVDQVSYEIQLNNQEFAKTVTNKKSRVPAQGSGKVEIPLPINHLKALGGVAKLLAGEEVGYEITGDAKISGIKIPFSEKGKFNLKDLQKASH
ncbi:MAG: LEA type 2 family protein [Bdellovibrio sp.]|nr:LEA type 2 family protein [Bdellovibrio sp.]